MGTGTPFLANFYLTLSALNSLPAEPPILLVNPTSPLLQRETSTCTVIGKEANKSGRMEVNMAERKGKKKEKSRRV